MALGSKQGYNIDIVIIIYLFISHSVPYSFYNNTIRQRSIMKMNYGIKAANETLTDIVLQYKIHVIAN